MSRSADIESFEGGAFHPAFGKGKASGTIHVSHSGVRFVAGDKSIELPLGGLVVTAGGANNRLLFFKHSNFPDWALFTSDHRIIEHPCLARNRDFDGQIGRIRKQKRFAQVIVMTVLLSMAGIIGLLVAGKDWMVQRIARQVPVEWERKLGETGFAQLSAGRNIVREPELSRQFQEITTPLLAGIQSERYEFQFHILEDSEINAFALPGGIVVIHSELLLSAGTPEEVAGVLAHEIAHVTRQHGMRNLIGSAGLYLVVQAFLGDATGLLAVLANNAPFLLTQKFSRDFEREADEHGWDYLVAARINPDGMISFFRKLEEEQERRNGEQPLGGLDPSLGFLSTHPATRERISRLEQKRSALESQSFTTFSLNFEAFQNNLRAHINHGAANN